MINQRLPYPGLRSFHRDETELFFGREASVAHMIRKLAASRFLAVLGASGSGKSSLMRTGLLDGLELGLLDGSASWWRIIDIRPAGEPIRNLARGLCGEPFAEADVDQMRAFLLRGPRSIVEWAATNLAPGENLLLLADQFEELFRYQHYEGRQEAEAFVSLLTESARNRDQPIYVTLTMRSEFLGACALFSGLAEALNEGQYLTPRMSREQCREAIVGPAGVCQFEIEPRLVTRLLNDLNDFAPWDERKVSRPGQLQIDRMVRRADQLPLLQHALNRLWIRATTETGGRAVVLKVDDYEALGGLRGALNQHAEEILTALGPERLPVVEHVFRALTVGGNIAEAVRRPTRLGELVKITGAPREDVIAVCDAFRAQGCNFLMPFAPSPLRDDTYVDISHESLIRQWSDLSRWLEKEARDADAIRRLGAAAELSTRGAADLLSGRELANLEGWRMESALPAAWASRYVEKPEAAFAYLDESIAGRRASQRSARIRQGLIACLAVAIIGTGSYVFIQDRQNSKLERLYLDLGKEQQKTKAAQATAEANAELARVERASADDARIRAETDKQQTDRTVREYLAGEIDKRQRAGNLVGALDLLTAIADKAPVEKLPLELTDRLAWQAAAQNALLMAPTDWLEKNATKLPKKHAELFDAPAAFELWRSRSESSEIYVVERVTGRIVDRFNVSESDTLQPDGDYFISLDGKAAILIGANNRLFRWKTGQTSAIRILDTRWLDRQVLSAAFDAEKRNVAVIFEQFGAKHLAVVPPIDADRTVVVPLHEIKIEGGSEEGYLDETGSGDFNNDATHVLAFVGDQPALALGDSLLVQVDLAKRSAHTLINNNSLHIQSMRGARVLRFWADAPSGDCSASVEAIASAEEEDTSTVDRRIATSSSFKPSYDPNYAGCFVDYDLTTGAFASSLILPPIPGWAASWPLAKTAIVTTAENTPSWGARPDSAESYNIAQIVAWRQRASDLSSDDREPTTVTSKEGVRVATISQGRIISDGTIGSQQAVSDWGKPLPPENHDMPKADDTGGEYVVSGDGKGVARFVSGGIQYFASGDRQWSPPLRLEGARECVRKWFPAGTGAIPGDKTGEPKQGVNEKQASNTEDLNVTAISGTKPDFMLIEPRSGSVAHLAIARQGQRYVGSIKCLGSGSSGQMQGAVADQILATDFDRGRVALYHEASGLLWIVADSETRTLRPGGPKLISAAFVGDALVTLTQQGDLLDYPLDGGASVKLVNPLPGAQLIYANGNDIALIRDESTDETTWLSVAVVGIKKADRAPKLSYLGFLPLPVSDIKVGQLRAGGRLELMFPGFFMQFALPAVASTHDIIDSHSALANGTGLKETDQSLLSLLVPASSQAAVAPDDEQFMQCAAAVNQMLHDDENAEVVLESCRYVSWATAAAVVKEADPNDEWPEVASILIGQVHLGDSTALVALKRWLGKNSSSDIESLANSQLDLLFPSVEESWLAQTRDTVAIRKDATTSTDPFVHMALAREFEINSTPDQYVKAVVHYSIAAKLFAKAIDSSMADAATAHKIALALGLSPAQRSEVANAVNNWTPVQPGHAPIPLDRHERMRKDIERLAELEVRASDPAAFKLLRLWILQLLAQEEYRDQTYVRTEIETLLLSTREWPPISLNKKNDLADAFKTSAQNAVDPKTALRLRLAGLRMLEHAGTQLALDTGDSASRVYAQMLSDVIAAGRDKVREQHSDFQFGKRSLNFSSSRGEDPGILDDTLAMLNNRLKLAEFLLPDVDAQAARAETLFWRAMNRNNRAIDKPEQIQGNYRDAYIALGDLPQVRSKTSLDDIAIFLAALRWSDDNEVPSLAGYFLPKFDLARGILDEFYAYGEQATWTLPWGNGQDNSWNEDRLYFYRGLSDFPNRNEATTTTELSEQLLRNIELGLSFRRTLARGGLDAKDDSVMQATDRSADLSNTIGYLAGREYGLRRAPDECDQGASFFADPERRAKGRIFEEISKSLGACEQAASKADDSTSRFLLARVVTGDKRRAVDRLKILIDLAGKEYIVAYNHLANLAIDSKLDKALLVKLRRIYEDRMLRDYFGPASRVLMTDMHLKHSNSLLVALAEQAAAVGSPEANLFLAQEAADPVEKAYRLKAAEKAYKLLATELASADPQRVVVLYREAGKVPSADLKSLREVERRYVEEKLKLYDPQAENLTEDEQSILRQAAQDVQDDGTR
ncbi:hypothetical protein ACCS33_29250 [Rhizobium ruizarguesonis]